MFFALLFAIYIFFAFWSIIPLRFHFFLLPFNEIPFPTQFRDKKQDKKTQLYLYLTVDGRVSCPASLSLPDIKQCFICKTNLQIGKSNILYII
jgi:hypothetical protein